MRTALEQADTQRWLLARHAPLQQDIARFCLVLAQLKGTASSTGQEQPKRTMKNQASPTEGNLVVDSFAPRVASTPAMLQHLTSMHGHSFGNIKLPSIQGKYIFFQPINLQLNFLMLQFSHVIFKAFSL